MNLFGDTLPFQLPKPNDYSFEHLEELGVIKINIPNGEIYYAESFFNEKISNRSLDYLLENKVGDWRKIDWKKFEGEKLEEIKFAHINWQHDRIRMYGKEIYLPRFSAWHGDNNKSYSYSGIYLNPSKWNKGLLYIKKEIEKISGTNFNSVLLNWYRDGSDYISWHTDAEKELGINPTIGSVNFGEERRFLIRRIDDHKTKIELPLKHGTLLIMSGELQHYWQHSVPKQKNVNNTRLNLTFRKII